MPHNVSMVSYNSRTGSRWDSTLVKLVVGSGGQNFCEIFFCQKNFRSLFRQSDTSISCILECYYLLLLLRIMKVINYKITGIILKPLFQNNFQKRYPFYRWTYLGIIVVVLDSLLKTKQQHNKQLMNIS